MSNRQLEELNSGITIATSALNWANNQPYFGGIDSWLTTAPAGPAIPSDLAAKGWTQTFTAQRVSLTNLLNTSSSSDDTCIRVTVTVKHRTRTAYVASRLFAPWVPLAE